MELHTKLRNVLERINFLQRYKDLREKFPFSDDSLENYSNEKALGIIESLGYKLRYDKKEKFFGLKELLNDFTFQFNISLKYGVVELIWDVVKDKERLTIGGPWGLIGNLLLKDDCNIKKPAFRNYDELEEILQEAFSIYEEFKKEVIKEFSN